MSGFGATGVYGGEDTMTRKLGVALGLTLAMLVAVAVAVAGGPTTVPSFQGKVYVLVGENTSLSQLTTKNAPYQLGTIKPASAWLSDYWGISHYSTSNYIAMTSGQFLECHQLDEKPATCNQNVTNIFGQLERARISWAAWNESMPAACWLVNAGENRFGNAYRVKHNPAAYYADIVRTDFQGAQGDVGAGAPCTHVVPTGSADIPNDTSAFETAARARTVPTFNYVVPNMCEDGHDNCKPTGNTIRQFDEFLRRTITAIQAGWNPAKDVIFVVYDEGQDGGPGKAVKFDGGHTPFAVLGAHVRPGVYEGFTNHYNLLHTLEDGFGLPYPSGPAVTPESAGAAPILAIWDP
jgi:hypothetical protein